MSITYPGFSFTITHQDPQSNARLGRLTTPHGTIETPAFVFCATKAAIKVALPTQMKQQGTQVILSNTYHLMLQPGADLVEQQGGLHKFIGWDGPMLTDSGGFQVFSMAHGGYVDEVKGKANSKRPKTMLKITEEGVKFKSYLDGSIHHLTPEKAVDVQRKLGPDIMLMFDESTPYNVTRDYTEKSMQRTHRWGARSLAEFERTHTGKQAIYGITQGGVYEDLRRESAEWLNSQDFFGQAVGGCYGANKEEFYRVINFARAPLRNDRPTHLLGVGEVEDIWELVSCGFDTFDCVSPTRMARHGTALSRESPKFKLNLFNAKFRNDPRPLDETLDNDISRTYSRAYIHHLLKAGEMLGMQILVLHNVAFMNNMLKTIREAIAAGRYLDVKKEWLEGRV